MQLLVLVSAVHGLHVVTGVGQPYRLAPRALRLGGDPAMRLGIDTPPRHSLPRSSLPRRSILRGLLATVALGARPYQPAVAAYTIVPTGSIAEKEARLVEVTKKVDEDPSDMYAFGEKAQLQYDIKMLESNSKFISETQPAVQAGGRRFLQQVSVPVPDMEAAVKFWKGGMGALVLSTSLVGGVNVTVIGYGPESFGREDGAKFSLRNREETYEKEDRHRSGYRSADASAAHGKRKRRWGQSSVRSMAYS